MRRRTVAFVALGILVVAGLVAGGIIGYRAMARRVDAADARTLLLTSDLAAIAAEVRDMRAALDASDYIRLEARTDALERFTGTLSSSVDSTQRELRSLEGALSSSTVSSRLSGLESDVSSLQRCVDSITSYLRYGYSFFGC